MTKIPKMMFDKIIQKIYSHIRSLDEYKIRYNYDKSKHVGQGDGESKIGDVVARDGNSDGQEENNDSCIQKKCYERNAGILSNLQRRFEVPHMDRN